MFGIARRLKFAADVQSRLEGAQKFADATNNGPRGMRGATMNPYTYKVAEIGKDKLHAVGGSRSAVQDGRIPTHYVDAGKDNPKLSVNDVLAHAEYVKYASGGNKNVALGSWVEDRTKKGRAQGVQMDATDLYPSDTHPKVIRQLLKSRNEKQSFNIEDPSQSVRNHAWRKYNGQQ